MLVRLTPSGRAPTAAPISVSATPLLMAAKLPSPRHVTAASRRSRRAGTGEPRSWASSPASRTASMTWAEEAGFPSFRRYRAIFAR